MSLASSRASIGASTGSDSTFRVGAGADVAGVGNDSAGDEGLEDARDRQRVAHGLEPDLVL